MSRRTASPASGPERARDFKDLYDSWIMANLQDRPDVEARGGFPMGYDEIDLRPFVDPDYGTWSIRRAIKEIYGADANGNLPLSRYFGGATSGTVEFPLGTAEPYSPIYKSYGGARPRTVRSTSGANRSRACCPLTVRAKCTAVAAPCWRTGSSRSTRRSAAR